MRPALRGLGREELDRRARHLVTLPRVNDPRIRSARHERGFELLFALAELDRLEAETKKGQSK